MTGVQGIVALVYFVAGLIASVTIWVYLLDWRLLWSDQRLAAVALAGGFGSTLLLGLLVQLMSH